MVHKQGGRIQELEKDIRSELESIGVIRVNFYFNEPENPRIEYKLKTPEMNIHCRELKKSLISRITANMIGIHEIYFDLDYQRDIYIAKLAFCMGFGVSDQSIQHGLLSLTYQEIQNHRRKFGI